MINFYYLGNDQCTIINQYKHVAQEYMKFHKVPFEDIKKFTNKKIMYEHEVDTSLKNWNTRAGFWERLPHEIQQCIKFRQMYLLISLPMEGDTICMFDNMHDYLLATDCPKDKLLYASGSLLAKEAYTDWCNKNNKVEFIKCISYPHFEHLPFAQSVPLDPRMYINRQWKALNLNRVLSPHRIVFGCLLEYYNLLKYLRMSMFLYDGNSNHNINNYDCCPLYKNMSKEKQQITDDGFVKLKKKLPLIADCTDGTINYAGSINPTLHTSTYFSIITASRYESHMNETHITEKEFKPIAMMQPFICVASTGQLANLKSLGYRTFSRWIDESYDLEKNDQTRMFMIIKEITRLCSISNKEWDSIIVEMLPTLHHNYHKFVNHAHVVAHYNTTIHDLIDYTEVS